MSNFVINYFGQTGRSPPFFGGNGITGTAGFTARGLGSDSPGSSVQKKSWISLRLPAASERAPGLPAG